MEPTRAHTLSVLLQHQNSRNQNNWKTGANINIYIPKERAKREEYNGYSAEIATTTAAAETIKIRSKDKDKTSKFYKKLDAITPIIDVKFDVTGPILNTIFICNATSRWAYPLGCKSVIKPLIFHISYFIILEFRKLRKLIYLSYPKPWFFF